ncbi:universal stress protein [Rhodovulum sp. YNF3179]|uniref:universal stress protein n=1 Tax=Rhodovulum sp. YNF3179 TaxID=3425127 RepID=UPI003D33E58D
MFSAILLPIDLEDDGGAARAAEAALRLARQEDAKLHVLSVLPDFGMSIVGSYFKKGFEREATAEAETKLNAWIADHGLDAAGATPHVAHGKIYDEIIHAADAFGCDAIVMGAHRPELQDYLLGPNAARVVRHARQSVFVVRDV